LTFVLVSTQAAPHIVSGAAQMSWQVPIRQVRPAGQPLPQEPQLAASFWRLRH
jgi:hypothetical protein